MLGHQTLWLPRPGDGSRLKLALNNWLAVLVEGMVETLTLSEALGLDPHLLLEAIGDGPMASDYAMAKGAAMLNGDFVPGFPLRHATKDAELALTAAHRHGVELPLTSALCRAGTRPSPETTATTMSPPRSPRRLPPHRHPVIAWCLRDMMLSGWELRQAVVEVRVARSSDVAAASPATRARLVSLLIRPTAPPLAVGIAVAASFIVAETLLVYLLEKVVPEMPFGVLFLLGVLVVSAGWGFGLAVTTTIASALVYAFVHLGSDGHIFPITGTDWVAIIIFVPIALLANVLAGQARLRAAEAHRRRTEAEGKPGELRVLADQQAALRPLPPWSRGGGFFRCVLRGDSGVGAPPGSSPTQLWSAMRSMAVRFCLPATTTEGRRKRYRSASGFRSRQSVPAMVFRAAAPPGGTAMTMCGLRTSNTSTTWGYTRALACRSWWTGGCGAPPMSDRRGVIRYPRILRRASGTSRTWSRPRLPTPMHAQSSRLHGPGSSRPLTLPGADSNATCTTVRSSGSCRWGSSCARPRRRCRPNGTHCGSRFLTSLRV